MQWVLPMLLCKCLFDCILYPLGPNMERGIDIGFIGENLKSACSAWGLEIVLIEQGGVQWKVAPAAWHKL